MGAGMALTLYQLGGARGVYPVVPWPLGGSVQVEKEEHNTG